MNHAVFWIFTIPAEISDEADHAFCLSGFLFTIWYLLQAIYYLLFFFQCFLSPLLKSPLAFTWFKVFDVTENQGDKSSWFFAPTRSRNIDFPGTAHSVFVEISRESVPAFLSTIKLNQLIQKVVIFCMLQVLNYFWIRANHICNIQ